MKNTNEIIKELGDWASEDGCGGCGFKIDVGGMCVTDLLLAARAALTDMQDRCARYAEEIMVLRQQLEEANHE